MSGAEVCPADGFGCGSAKARRPNARTKTLKLIEKAKWDQPLLKELSQAMMDASICGLGQAAPNAILSSLRHFRSEFEAHL